MHKIRIYSCVLFLLIGHISYAQECHTAVEVTAPDSRYMLLNNGTEVKDQRTGLIWQRCSLGQQWDGKTCLGSSQDYTWKEALSAAKSMGSGYRLPNIRELLTLIEYSCHDVAINEKFFPRTSYSFYWSSSPQMISENSKSAYYVYFQSGDSGGDLMIYKHKVRAVRQE